MQFTAHEFCKAAVSINESVSDTSPKLGAAIDTLGFEEALCMVITGVLSGTSPTADVKWQEADTSGGTYTDISGAAFTQVTTANDDNVEVGRLNLRGRKRFIRAHGTYGGTSPVGEIFAGVILLGAKNLPTSQVQTTKFNIDT